MLGEPRVEVSRILRPVLSVGHQDIRFDPSSEAFFVPIAGMRV
jgi:hypothetical protein